jgi:hypothetical protein
MSAQCGFLHGGNQVVHRIAGANVRRARTSESERPLEPLETIGLIGPDARLQPADGVVVADVDGLQIQAQPGCVSREFSGQRRLAAHVALQYNVAFGCE